MTHDDDNFVVKKPSHKAKKAEEGYKRRLIKGARINHLGEDAYEAHFKVLGIPVPFGSLKEAVEVFVASLRKAHSDGDLTFEFLARVFADMPALDDATFRKLVRELPKPENCVKRFGAGSPQKAIGPYAQTIADSIKLTRPDISGPELAGLVYECLLSAGAPANLFRQGFKTVEGWLKS